MDIEVKNFVACNRARIDDLQGLAVLTGPNGNGKSSILDAVGCACTGDWRTRERTTKKACSGLVQDGAKEAYVRVRTADTSVLVSWPEAAVAAEDGAGLAGHPLGVGTMRFTALPRAERERIVVDLMDAQPTKDDLAAALKDVGIKATKSADQVWAVIEEKGWDGAARHYRDEAIKYKGRWEETAGGQKWGSKRGEDWTPEGWTKTLASADADKLAKAVADAEAAVNRAIGQVAVDETRMQELQRRAAAPAPTDEEMRQAQEEIEALDARLAALRKSLQDLPQAEWQLFTCPSCQTPIRFVAGHSDGVRLLEVAGDLPEGKELKDLRLQRASLDGEIGNVANTKLPAARKVQADLEAQRRDVEAAAAELEKAQQRTGTQDELNKARQALGLAQVKQRAHELWVRATKLHRIIMNMAAVAGVTAPEGVRMAVAERAVKAFNERVAEFCKSWDLPAVKILPGSLDVRWGDRDYIDLSPGHRRRVDIVLQCAFAAYTGAPAMIVDDVDRIDPSARAGLFRLLDGMGIPVLVGLMTRKDLSVAQQIAGRKGWRAFWVEDGEIKEIEAAPAKTAA